MKSLWIRTGADRKIELDHIVPPIFPMASADDMWTGTHDRPESIPSKAIQCLWLSRTGWAAGEDQQLIFVLTGTLRIDAQDVTLFPGDLLLSEHDVARDVMSFSEDCRVLILHVPEWHPKIAAGTEADTPPAEAHAPNFKWLYTGPDGLAYFAPFDELFDESRGWGATVKPAYDTMLIEQLDGFFMDWHPEGANNLVVILSGELELEAGGDGGKFETFRPGDICFAVDRTGQGHIDRARSATRLATIVIPTKAFEIPSR